MSAFSWALPAFIALVVLCGLARGVDLYAAFVRGARGGVAVSLKTMPYVVGMVFAVGLFRAGGGFAALSSLLGGLLSPLGIPPEVLPLALMRPFSGGGSAGLLAALFAQQGADSFVGRVAATFMGSSETLFYTTSVYFGSVGVRDTRYVVPVALLTDAFGLVVSCLLCRWVFGG